MMKANWLTKIAHLKCQLCPNSIVPWSLEVFFPITMCFLFGGSNFGHNMVSEHWT